MPSHEIAHAFFCFWPDAASLAKTLNQPPIVRSKNAKTMRSDFFASHIGIDFSEEFFAHA